MQFTLASLQVFVLAGVLTLQLAAATPISTAKTNGVIISENRRDGMVIGMDKKGGGTVSSILSKCGINSNMPATVPQPIYLLLSP
jgi:hypothetical protein